MTETPEVRLAAAILTASMEGDFELAEQLQAQLEALQMDHLPPEGRYRVMIGRPVPVPERWVRCPDCHDNVWCPGGVRFAAPPEVDSMSDEDFLLDTHRELQCPAWKYRWHRLKWSTNRKRPFLWTLVLRWHARRHH